MHVQSVQKYCFSLSNMQIWVFLEFYVMVHRGLELWFSIKLLQKNNLSFNPVQFLSIMKDEIALFVSRGKRLI